MRALGSGPLRNYVAGRASRIEPNSDAAGYDSTEQLYPDSATVVLLRRIDTSGIGAEADMRRRRVLIACAAFDPSVPFDGQICGAFRSHIPAGSYVMIELPSGSTEEAQNA